MNIPFSSMDFNTQLLVVVAWLDNLITGLAWFLNFAVPLAAVIVTLYYGFKLVGIRRYTR